MKSNYLVVDDIKKRKEILDLTPYVKQKSINQWMM